MFTLGLVLGIIVGAVAASLIVLNNKNKALAVIQAAKEAAEKEATALEAKLKK